MRAQRLRIVTSTLLLVLLFHFTPPAFAADDSQDDDRGWFVSGIVAAAAAPSTVSPALAGLLGYQRNRFVRWEILEVTYAPLLKHPVHVTYPGYSAFYNDGNGLVYSTVLASTDKAVGLVTSNLRVRPWPGRHKLSPYAVAGVGLARLRERLLLRPTPVVVGMQPRRTDDFAFADWRAPYATLVFGGGASLARTDRLSLDVDARYYRVFAGEDFTTINDLVIGRVGVQVTYWPRM